MHIADGALSTEVMVATNVLAAGGVGIGLYRLDYERVPRVGVLSATFFVASFVHVSIPPASLHLLLNGLLGFLLGWAALPALAAALFLQWILLGFGGISALGANVLVMGVPAVVCYYAFGVPCRCVRGPRSAVLLGGAAGFTSVLLSCGLLALALHLSNAESYALAVKALLVGHVPVAIAEAIVLGACAGFLKRVRPDLLAPPVVHARDGRETDHGE